MKNRIFRSPDADYYHEDMSGSLEIYTSDYLRRLKDNGFNAIWLRAVLREISSTAIFPEFGTDFQSRQETLRTLIKRCAEFNIKVYLYFNEPLTFPVQDKFWENYPDLRGTTGSSAMDNWSHTRALCTSHQPVLDFLYHGMNHLFTHCPGLGGVFLITRSEHHTHCYSHHDEPNCPLCGKRTLAEVVAEIVNTIASGIYAASEMAEVIAWNWEWPAEAEADIISRFDRRIILMGAFERGGRKVIAGKERLINEYALSYIGPGKSFSTLYDECSKRGMKIYAKLQIGTTHELATVRNLPLIPNLLKKVQWLRNHKIQGALCCWNFGSRLSLNTFAFQKFLEYDLKQDDETILLTVASEYFSRTVNPAKVLTAWKIFVEAFDHYPFCVSFLYKGPVNYVLRYPFPHPEAQCVPMQRSWIPLKVMGTNLKEAVNLWRGEDMSCEASEGQFDLNSMVDCLKKQAETFESGLAVYDSALSGDIADNSTVELKNAIIIGGILNSVYYTFAAYQLCQTVKFNAANWINLADAECRNLQKILPLLKDEKEIGFHSEAQDWFFTEKTVNEKLAGLNSLLQYYKNKFCNDLAII